MRVIKRDGRIVDYDRTKILVAIRKANDEVKLKERISEGKIEGIIQEIEGMKKEMMQVEEIQDIIEEKLMEDGKYTLAKTYILYRYTRELVRKANTTDESILSLIKHNNKDVMEENSNKNAIIASTQRDLIAGEVSKDLTKRILLPEKISKAHEEGILHFHDADYFLQSIFNCCLINIKDMFENGTVMNGKLIESPKSFQVACTVMTQIISAVASSQYGGQSVDVRHLGKYLRITKEKYQKRYEEEFGGKLPAEIVAELVADRVEDELKSGVQTIQYQINTLMTTNGQSPFVTLFLNLDKDDEYIEENAQIIEEILRQRLEGIKNEKGVYITPAFPKLIYVLDEHNCLKGGKYDYITKLAVRCSAKRLYPDYISAKKMRENYEGNVFSCMGCRSFLTAWKDENGNYKFEGRFNQGVVSLNLPQIGIIAQGNEELFWQLLEERLSLCFEALMCRHRALEGTISDVSPIHWQYGAIARLQKGET
ncbi:MAG: anaerobic ribonucleoside-triphosphate reductase, partial [Lachnospiraceae bacterium]|nr:anaerobic ribonucleoside-triphosphate reductase [Lachnospiraceae bacterium]